MNVRMIFRQTVLGVIVAAVVVLAQGALGADGTWTNLAGGVWGTSGNWAGGTVASGTDAIADFNTLNITANVFVNNDAARTVGMLRFGDTTPSHNWTLTNSTLTLAVSSGTPTITVSNQTATISVGLQGTQGLIKNGAGTLTLDSFQKTDAGNTYSGGTYVLAGTLKYGSSQKNGVSNKLGTGPVYLGDTNGSASVVLGQIYDSDSLPNNIVIQSGNSGTITIQASGGNDAFAGTVTLGSPNSSGKGLTVAGNNLSFSFNGVIQDPAGLTPGTAGPVTIAGSPVLFSGNNSYSGGTVINSGSLKLGHVSALGSGGLTVNGGGVDLNANSVTVGALSGTGGFITDFGAAGTTILTVTQSVATTYAGVISNGASRVVAVTKTGSGTLTLSGANTYTGPTRVNAGGFIGGTGGSCVNSTLTVAAGATNGVRAVEYGGQWACAGLTYTGGVACLDFDLTTLPLSTAFASLIVNGDLSVTGTVDVVVRNGYWPVTGTYPLVSYSGSLKGSGSFNLASLPAGVTATLINNTGAKRLDLSVTTVPSVSLQTSVWTNLVTGSASGIWGVAANWTNGVPNGADAIADFSTLNITANSTINNESPHMAGTLRFGDKTTADRDWTLTNSTLTLATSLGFPTIDVSNRSVTIGTALLGTQGLCKTGAGQLNIDQNLLSGATGLNTYSGGTYIMAGTLMFGTFNNNSITGLIGPGTVYLGDIGGSANVVLQSQYGSYSLTNNIVLLSGNTGTMQINNNGGWLTLSGTITLGKANGSGKSLTLGRVSTGGLGINGVIQDPVGMTPGTAGTVTIASSGYVTVNAANTYSGATVIDGGGTWYANAANNGGLPAGTALTVNGTLDMVDRTITVGALAGTGIVDRTYNGGSARVLTVGSKNTSTLFSGVIKNSQASYPVSLVKIGSGALTLSGTNTYTGATTVSNGTLAVSGALSSSGVTVCTGSAFAAGSTGVVGRATLGGTLTFQNSSALLVDVAPPLADAVVATGNVVIGTGVEVRLSGNQEKSGSWELIKSTSGTVQGSDPVLINGLHGAKLTRTATAIVLTIPPKGTMIRFL